ncbi:hypothetical protein BJ508DRAFT_312431 [Ascobolus immersus RN42]|uniref:Uncharacterized protein n=1 Tax=Ascobolus immersus RN42 TaxID=1160509 RepID=A0A3N4HPN2_ASCIM|nr:hypothetical protein BJ508DRAFT_312431 [Ascobolus immersus RN42]
MSAEGKKELIQEASENLIRLEKERDEYAEFTDEEGSQDEEEASNNDIDEQKLHLVDYGSRRFMSISYKNDNLTVINMLAWIRLLGTAIQASELLILKDVSPRISVCEIEFECLEVSPPIPYTFDWPDVVHELFRESPEQAKKVNRALTKYEYKTFAGKKMDFTGTVHPEAIARALCFEMKNDTYILDDSVYTTLESLGQYITYSPIGVSDPSCPICRTILSETYSLNYLQDSLQAPADASDNYVYSCALPYGMEEIVMRKVVSKLRASLRRNLKIFVDTNGGRNVSKPEDSPRRILNKRIHRKLIRDRRTRGEIEGRDAVERELEEKQRGRPRPQDL